MSLRTQMSAPAELCPRAFARVTGFAHAAAGLMIPDSKRAMVQARLARRLAATGHASFESYLDHVEGPEGLAERHRMISALTTNVTSFFREPHHFEILSSRVIPASRTRLREGARVRFWSAGCSTGQEAYSIALSLLREIPDAADRDVRILATDIDRDVLGRARDGVFDETQMRILPSDLRSKYFEATGGQWRAGAALRALVSFRELNLIEPWPMRSEFDAIFCRNVVIYFSEETQRSLWPRFAGALRPGGHLFLGHSERVHAPALHGLVPDGVTSYRRAGSRPDIHVAQGGT